MRAAIVLLSGGLDSATTLAIARHEGYACHALSVDYGQRHRSELAAARRVADSLGTSEHKVIAIGLEAIGGSALTDQSIPVPEQPSAGIPATYVPARNSVLLALALGWAEALGARDIFIGVNAVDYSVGGDTRVWIRTPRWARLMAIRDLYDLPEDHYETIAVDPTTLSVDWKPVTGRFRHASQAKRCFRIRLERGQQLLVTEDHSLFTIDPGTARLTTITGVAIARGTPIVVPFDLSDVARAWQGDLACLDLSGLPASYDGFHRRRSIVLSDEYITNRLKRTRIPVQFPVSDAFLYVIGLWLAEGGKSLNSKSACLAFSVGGIPGAVRTLRAFCEGFGVQVSKSPANKYDYSISSSVLAGLFRYLGLFGMAKRGEKSFPPFFWDLSQRQRRLVVAGLFDGDGSHVFNGEFSLAQKSHAIIDDAYHCLSLDGIFARMKMGRHEQKLLVISRSQDFRRLVVLYPLKHTTKLHSYRSQAAVRGRDKATGLWKCPGLWDAVASADLRPGEKTRIYNAGGKYDVSYRSQRSAFAQVESLRPLVNSKLAFLRVIEVQETTADWMYDLAVEGAETFVANGVLAHNSGYPDCRPAFIAAFEHLADLATKAGAEGAHFRIHAPLIALAKAEIIRRGTELGLDYGLTVSCYQADEAGRACGVCDSCRLRAQGFRAAGLPDPTRYR